MELEALRALVAAVAPETQGILLVYLFGSRAKGKPNPKDYDLAVLFDDAVLAEGSRRYDRADELYRVLRPHLDAELDVVDLNRADWVLVQQVLKYHKLLYALSSSTKAEWEKRARYRVWDMQPLFARYRDAVFARIDERVKQLDRSAGD